MSCLITSDVKEGIDFFDQFHDMPMLALKLKKQYLIVDMLNFSFE